MRVCLLTCFPYPGTSSTAYYGYSQELARQGVDVVVLSAYLADRRTSNVQHIRDGDVQVYKLPVGTFVKKSLEPTRFAFKAFALLNQLQDEQPFNILQVQAFPNLGLALYPTGQTPDAVILDIRTSAISDRFLNVISKLVLKFQARLFPHVLVLDSLLADFLFGGHKDNVAVIPLGADFGKFHPGDRTSCRKSLGFQLDDLVFIYVGNLDAVRTVEKMMLAFAQVAKGHQEAKLLLVGGGDQEEYLHSLVKQKQLADRVVFTGIVPFLDIPDFMRAVDVGLAYVPDKIQYRNQPPLKTVEYLATGLPVIATDTPGNKRFVDHERNGLIVEDTVDGLVRGMNRMLEQKDIRRKMARVARESVEKFSYEYIVREQLLPFYKRCLGI